MTCFVSRTCTEVVENADRNGSESSSRPLEDFRETGAYVLLGAPGAGKTEAFKQEAGCPGGCYVTAREFVTFVDDQPEWRDAILFIDGLDEVRAGATDERTPFDNIRAKLNRLRCPRFRLSCRGADWFGTNDRVHLKRVAPGGEVKVLRLDSLSAGGIREILRQCSGIEDADGFMATADEKSIGALLANPQSLLLLAKVVADRNWPATRKELFELACQELAGEHNPEHQIATRGRRQDISRLLDVAGRLCAAQLLTGSAGYTLTGAASSEYPEYLGLDQIPGEDRAILHRALGTNLFQVPSEGRVVPFHRQIAEFLAAKHLAGLINDGLPAGRILALMTGHDGGVVSELRGFCAWLAVHSKTSRVTIIERDPLGVILYGDAREFSSGEKRQVLECLGRETKRDPLLVSTIQMDSRMRDLVTPDTEEYFRKILTSPTQDDARQSFALILVEMLAHGQAFPSMTDLVMEIIKDQRWRPGVRYAAMNVLVQSEDNDQLMALLEGIDAGSISDPQDDLLGSLLIKLYPAKLSPTDILKYLRIPKVASRAASYVGRYYVFWTSEVLHGSTSTQLAELLDGFVAQYDRMRDEVQTHPRDRLLRRIPVTVLSRFLETTKEEVDPRRLFDWLGVVTWVGDWKHDIGIAPDSAKRIRLWLGDRPDLQKSLILIGLERCLRSPESNVESEFKRCMFMVFRRLFDDAVPPADSGHWYLDLAMIQTNPVAAKYLIRKVASLVRNHGRDQSLSRQAVEERLSESPGLLRAFSEKMNVFEESDAQERQRRLAWHQKVKPQEAALRENRAPPALLDTLAATYHDRFTDILGDTPRDRLQDLLGDDENLIDAVLQGFRDAINRDDVPSDAEIIRLGTQNQRHFLAFPILAGLEESARIMPTVEIPLDEQQRLALAIYYTSPVPGRTPVWFSQLLASNPTLVADVLVQSTRSKMRFGGDFQSDLHELVHSPDYTAVARLVSLPLLVSFPVRCTESQLSSLNILLRVALRHSERAALLGLIEKKLAYSSMHVAQHIYWLATGLLAAPESYRERLESCVAVNQRRLRRLTEFIGYCDCDSLSKLIEDFDVPALQFLIRSIGASCQLYSLENDGVTVADSTDQSIAQRVFVFIDRLALMPSPAATKAFEELSSDDNLRPWRLQFGDAAYRQNVGRREASFKHCNIDQAFQTLDDQTPANAADLAALTVAFLDELSENIRDGNTSDWRQHWNVDPHNRARKPKPENACRDALLSDLKNRLKPSGIDAQPEGSYADDNRSDIRVSYGDFNVPIEIKRNCHPRLWSAIKNQLIAKYTRDPGADGYGIYLVFWFGDTKNCRLAPGLKLRPESAAELEDCLRDTLSSDEKRKISIRVIDVGSTKSMGSDSID